MLAEPRRRQKYSINPRGLDWANDDNKVGQKLLEKMGWRKGKALGLNEDGCKEHVKVSTKSDRKGVGCTQQHADSWIAHQEDFNSILSTLNKDVNTESSAAAFSLSDKSKNSRSRVHYQKFTKGKDLSRYHSTDLNCIFGERQKNVARTKQWKTDEVESESTSQNDEENMSFGVLTVTSSTSIDHYFANKLANLQSKTKKNELVSEEVSKAANDSASTFDIMQDKHRKQIQKQLTGVSSETGGTVDCDTVIVKQRRKKRRKFDDDCCAIDERLQSKSLDSSHTSKKKKKKKCRDTDDILECSNNRQNEKTAETSKKSKKRPPSTTAASELNQLEHISIPSKKRNKLTHVDCIKR